MQAPFILGLTGGIGSGKSAASHWFETQGIQVVDADIVAREVVESDDGAAHRRDIMDGIVMGHRWPPFNWGPTRRVL